MVLEASTPTQYYPLELRLMLTDTPALPMTSETTAISLSYGTDLLPFEPTKAELLLTDTERELFEQAQRDLDRELQRVIRRQAQRARKRRERRKRRVGRR